MQESLAAFVSGIGGVVTGAGMIFIWLRQTLNNYATLKKRVEEHLEQRLEHAEQEAAESQQAAVELSGRVRALETKIEPINVPLLSSQITMLSRQLDAVEGKLDRCVEATTRQDERLRTLQDFCNSLQGELPRLKGSRPG